jgi:hypothetical protein
MSNQQQSSKSRPQTLLLAAIAALLAVDVGARFIGSGEPAFQSEPAQVVPVSYTQPEVTMSNPLDQRRRMISEMQSIDSRLQSIESKLKSRLRVEVTNFPKPPAPDKE